MIKLQTNGEIALKHLTIRSASRISYLLTYTMLTFNVNFYQDTELQGSWLKTLALRISFNF